jgi:murein DD-endopeptidase MepM/ murein hydrolase activator NlpD
MSLQRVAQAIAPVLVLFLGIACGGGDGGNSPSAPGNDVCSGYPAWQTSDYVLPYPVGSTRRVSQGNCTNASHQGTLRYSYDLQMPFGSVVTAARDGMVTGVRVDQPTGSRGLTASNYLQITHPDGTVGDYVHLAPAGNLVELGIMVQAGDAIARTGDTGDVGDFPHLHFNITPCANNLACDTLPVTFRNTSPNPSGLIQNQHYEALPFP